LPQVPAVLTSAIDALRQALANEGIRRLGISWTLGIAADSALMLPPTVVCLEQVAAATSAAQFLADEVPMVAPITPVPVRVGDAVVIRCTLPLSHMFGRRLPIAGDSRPRSAPLAGE